MFFELACAALVIGFECLKVLWDQNDELPTASRKGDQI